MAKIYGQLENAQLQTFATGSLPSPDKKARIAYDTTLNKPVFDDGSAWRAVLSNDQKCVFGTSGTANANIRFNRVGTGVLQFVLGGDTTVEGTGSTNLAQLSFKVESYATGSLPSALAGRLAYDTTTNQVKRGNGSSWDAFGTLTGTETLTNKTLTSPTINTASISAPDLLFGVAANTNRLYLPRNTTTNLAALNNLAGLFAYDTTTDRPVYNNGSGWVQVGSVTLPTVQKFTSGSGTYTTPAGVKYIRVKMVGGGGGGSGSAVNGAGGDGGNGGSTTFGTTLLSASPGLGATTLGGAGGAASLGSGPLGIAIAGGGGANRIADVLTTAGMTGGGGGVSAFGGAGKGGGGFPSAATGSTAGSAASTNSGSGGGGGGAEWDAGFPSYSGAGGGAGGYVEAIITSPSSSYSYAVGAGGTAGTAGSGGLAGGAGAAGVIIVEEFY